MIALGRQVWLLLKLQQLGLLVVALGAGSVIVLAAADAVALWQLARMMPTTRTVAAELTTAGQNLTNPRATADVVATLARATGQLTILQGRIQRARQAVDHWQWLGWLAGRLPGPGVALSHEIAAATVLLRIADTGAQGAVAIMPVATSIVRELGPRLAAAQREPAGGGAIPATLALLREVSVQQQAQLADMAVALAALDADLSRMDGVDPDNPLGTDLPVLTQTRVGRRVAPSLRRLESLLPASQAAVQALLALPEAFPNRAHARYVLIAQKTAELRATGGFWGNIGLIEIANGRPTGFDYFRSQLLDRPQRLRLPPPTPLVRYMGMDQWMLRDANWWPDFPTSVNQLQEFMQYDLGWQADGVIAFDETVLRGILDIVGPVNVPVYGERIDANNVLDRLEFYAYGPGERDSLTRGRRPFFELLAQALISQAVHLDPGRVRQLGTRLLTLLERKHLLLYAREPAAQALARRLGWDGRVDNASGDYLYVVDTNVDYTEPYPGIRQAIDYEIEFRSDGQVWAYLTIDYTNTNAASLTAEAVRHVRRGLADYVRIYVPAGSVLERAIGLDSAPETWDEGNRTVFGGFFRLEPGQRRRIAWHYRLPDIMRQTANTGAYLLTMQHQPGAPRRQVTVRLLLPWNVPAASAAAVVPLAVLAPTRTISGQVRQLQDAPTIEYRVRLASDIRLAIPLPRDGIAPRPIALRRWALTVPQLRPRPMPWVSADLARRLDTPAARAPVLHRAPPTETVPSAADQATPMAAATPTVAATVAAQPAAQPVPTVRAPRVAPTRRAAAAPQRQAAPTPVARAQAPSLPAGIIVRLPPPQQLVIPKLGLDIPIVPTGHDLAEWRTARDAAGWLTGTANPGERGNVVLAGHNDAYGAVFARLQELAPGDEVVLVSAAGRFQYVVVGGQVLPPTIRAALYPTLDPRATLITCTPSPTNESRYIVTAVLVG